MRKEDTAVTGFILAGGQSSRMGQDKGLLQLQGKALVQHTLEELKECVSEVVIIANKPEYDQFGLRVVADIVPQAGPVGGIYTALENSATDLNFIVSCDMPFITRQAVQCMLDQASGAAVTVPTVNGLMQPLFGVYHRSCLPQVRWHVEHGKLRLTALIKDLDHQVVELEKLLPHSEQLFQNLNTPQDYDNALKLKK